MEVVFVKLKATRAHATNDFHSTTTQRQISLIYAIVI